MKTKHEKLRNVISDAMDRLAMAINSPGSVDVSGFVDNLATAIEQLELEGDSLTHEKVVEVLHNTISMEPSELIAGDHRIKDESIIEAATSICKFANN